MSHKILKVGRAKRWSYGVQPGPDGYCRDYPWCWQLKDDAFWYAGDLRFTNAFLDADTGRIYAAHGVNDSDNYLAWRWYEVDLAGGLSGATALRKGTFGGQFADTGFPSVATDVSGNVFVTYSLATWDDPTDLLFLGDYLGAWTAVITPGNTVPDGAKSLEPGGAAYNFTKGAEMWGLQTAMNRDPLDGNYVWSFNQAAMWTAFGGETDTSHEVINRLSA